MPDFIPLSLEVTAVILIKEVASLENQHRHAYFRFNLCLKSSNLSDFVMYLKSDISVVLVSHLVYYFIGAMFWFPLFLHQTFWLCLNTFNFNQTQVSFSELRITSVEFALLDCSLVTTGLIGPSGEIQLALQSSHKEQCRMQVWLDECLRAKVPVMLCRMLRSFNSSFTWQPEVPNAMRSPKTKEEMKKV